MRGRKIEGIVIRKRNFSEKDRILTLFTKKEGKVEALAKGSRRPGSRFSYCSDMGFTGVFHLHQGKSLDLVTEVESIYFPEGLRGSVLKTEVLGYCFKVINHTFELNVAHENTYEVLKKVVINLSEREDKLLFLSFLANVIYDLGLWPETKNCIVCNKVMKEEDEFEFSAKGGIQHSCCSDETSMKISSNDLKLLRIFKDFPFEKTSKLKVDQETFEKVYKVIHIYMEWNFGKVLPEKIL